MHALLCLTSLPCACRLFFGIGKKFDEDNLVNIAGEPKVFPAPLLCTSFCKFKVPCMAQF